MILCNEECLSCCDFCAYQMSCGDGSGEGFCISKGKYVDWSSDCQDDFHCFRSLLEPDAPNLLKFLELTTKIVTQNDCYDGPTLKERFSAWRNLADYTFEGKRRGKNA